MNLLFRYSAAFLFLFGLVSFSKKEPVTANPNVTFKADLHPENEVSTGSSTAIGTAILVYNTATKKFTLTITYTGQTAVSGYIHNETPGMMGPVIFPLSNLTSPITYTSTPLDSAQEADLNANRYVLNLYSPAFASGKIRAIMIKQEDSGGGPPPPPGDK